MCGRFLLYADPKTLAMKFDFHLAVDFEHRYNIAPSQEVPVVRYEPANDRREMVRMRWGLVPFWADDESCVNRLINARAETVHEKPAFRNAFAKCRCIVVASGFYEWKKLNGSKQPYLIKLANDEPMAFAGIWEPRSKGDESSESFAIITTEANEQISSLHDRMPVILSEQDVDTWLDEDSEDEALKELLRPTEQELEYYLVSRKVNSPKNDSKELIERADDGELW
ncbi:MAG: SOS response-associated peptidase [Planctomycetota bacterium]|nr:SOS response-associated peptidase [Planctomycetota bacterium]